MTKFHFYLLFGVICSILGRLSFDFQAVGCYSVALLSFVFAFAWAWKNKEN